MDNDESNPLLKHFSSRPYSPEDEMARAERFRKLPTKFLECHLEEYRQELFTLRQAFPDMDYLSHPQTGKVRRLESKIRSLEKELDRRDSERVESLGKPESEQESVNDTPPILPETVAKPPQSRREFVLSILRDRGLSLNRFAIEVRLDPKTIRNFINDKRCYPDTRLRIAEALGVGVKELPD